ncbi:MAG: TonB-dependent receptor plug domain-containing protein [Myxococcota bacterium]
MARTEFLGEAYERVVVSASRVGQDPLDSPATVTVLTADDIRLSGVVDLPDLLRRVVGVEIMAPAAGHSEIAIRGFQRKMNNKVLVLIDGRSTGRD